MKNRKSRIKPFNISFVEGFPTVASCYWYGSRTNNRKLDKLYIVIKSTKCSLHFTSALTDRRTPVDLWCHKFAILVKFIIFVNSIYRIRAGTFLELTSETAICNNLTAKVSVKYIKWFAICASLKLTDWIWWPQLAYFTMCKITNLIEIQLTHFSMVSLLIMLN